MGDGILAAGSNTNYDGPGVPVQTVVTVVPHHGGKAPAIQKSGRGGAAGATARYFLGSAQGQKAGLQLLLLLDDSARLSMASQLGVLREFIDRQPPSTLIGVGYMYNGTVNMA